MKKMFYLLLFCIFDNEKLNQRTLEDTFNSSGFKALFGLGEEEKIRKVLISKGSPKLTLIISKKSTSRCTEDFRTLFENRNKNTTLSGWTVLLSPIPAQNSRRHRPEKGKNW